jgi:hypothetical protein
MTESGRGEFDFEKTTQTGPGAGGGGGSVTSVLHPTKIPRVRRREKV